MKKPILYVATKDCKGHLSFNKKDDNKVMLPLASVGLGEGNLFWSEPRPLRSILIVDNSDHSAAARVGYALEVSIDYYEKIMGYLPECIEFDWNGMVSSKPSVEIIKKVHAELYPNIKISGIYNSHINFCDIFEISKASLSKVSLFATATLVTAAAVQQYGQEGNLAL